MCVYCGDVNKTRSNHETKTKTRPRSQDRDQEQKLVTPVWTWDRF